MGPRDLRNTHLLPYRTQEGSPQLLASELHRRHRCSAFTTPTEPGLASLPPPAGGEQSPLHSLGLSDLMRAHLLGRTHTASRSLAVLGKGGH